MTPWCTGPLPKARHWPTTSWRRITEAFSYLLTAGGKRLPSERWFDSVSPSTKEILAKIAEANTEDVDEAVTAAAAALPKWVAMGGHQRARYLYAIARQIQKHSRLFAVLEAMDNGKPIRETRDIDIPLVARHFYHHAGWAQLRDTELAEYKEIGVIGQIIPWNFPLLMLAWKIAPALAMGNTVVLKPAEFTSLTALLFADICRQIGLPEGVVNIITGDGKNGCGAGESQRCSEDRFYRFYGSRGRSYAELPREAEKNYPWNWVANRLLSFLKMPTSIVWWKALWMRYGLTRGRSAVPVQDSSFRKV